MSENHLPCYRCGARPCTCGHPAAAIPAEALRLSSTAECKCEARRLLTRLVETFGSDWEEGNPDEFVTAMRAARAHLARPR